MKLGDYLAKRGETQTEFAARSGIPQTTLTRIVAGSGTRTATALRIVEVTGGMVSFADLAGEPRGAARSGEAA